MPIQQPPPPPQQSIHSQPEKKQEEGSMAAGGNIYPVIYESAVLDSFNHSTNDSFRNDVFVYPPHHHPQEVYTSHHHSTITTSPPMMPSSSSSVLHHSYHHHGFMPTAPVMFDYYQHHHYQEGIYLVPNPYQSQPQQQPHHSMTHHSHDTTTTYIVENPNVPSTRPKTEEEKPYIVHTLNKHTDTLTKLALRFNCNEEDIKMLNNILCDDLDLYEHDTILIPKREVQFIKENYDLEETKRATERQRSLMVSNFAKMNKISIDEARTYLEMHDWKSKEAREELLKDQAWEKQTMGKVLSPGHFAKTLSSNTTPTHRSKTASSRGGSSHSSSNNTGLTRRAPPRNSEYMNYSYEMIDMK
ncbi:hypothetical protein FDP41_007639 [Naegleria fowleri]|uniref:LysM domain-containing protein n=1 Tax=Naegleria fowleri TaxID=5763 RepID=A0A6A5CAZ2_NAEFO|nr:uncharacterized protein FDP41_007639 [Naegleria fowleri]KAF0983724.1 hypothetical protein FDP41_007639 [Naegleria fowleri]CAG4716839.1 unnamed protein product [Naegleria fowleri]